MRQAIDETRRRRVLQEAYNVEHDITPQTIRKAIRSRLEQEISARRTAREVIRAGDDEFDRTQSIADLEGDMLAAAEALDFERAAKLRDRIRDLQNAPALTSLTPKDAGGRDAAGSQRNRGDRPAGSTPNEEHA